MGGNIGEQLFEAEYSGLFKAVHDETDLKLYIAVGFNMELIYLHALFGGYGVVDAGVLEVCHWGAYIEVFDVQAKVVGSMFCIRYGSVDVYFCIYDG